MKGYGWLAVIMVLGGMPLAVVQAKTPAHPEVSARNASTHQGNTLPIQRPFIAPSFYQVNDRSMLSLEEFDVERSLFYISRMEQIDNIDIVVDVKTLLEKSSPLETIRTKQTDADSDILFEIEGSLEEGDGTFGEDNRRFDVYRLEGLAWQSVEVTAEGNGFSPRVLLLNLASGNATIISNQEDATVLQTILTIPDDGDEYGIGVASADVPGEGEYRLRVRAISAAEARLREISREADSLFNQGVQQSNRGQWEQSLASWERALRLYREISDRSGEGITLENLGLAYTHFGQYEQAIDLYDQALAIAREASDSPEQRLRQRIRESHTLGKLGVAYRESGRYEQAIDLLQQQIVITREIGDRTQTGLALGNLGIAYRESGQYELAIEILEQRIAIAREIGDRAGEGSGLGNLGLAYDGLGQYQQAIEAYEQRLVIAQELGERDRESLTLGNLAETYVSLGNIQRAIELLQVSLEIAREIDYSEQEDRVVSRLGSLSSLLEQSSSFTPLEITDELGEGSEIIRFRLEDGSEIERFANVHQIQGTSNQKITIHINTGRFIPRLLLIRSEDNALVMESSLALTSQDNVWLIAALPSDGTYKIYVTTHNENGLGSYRLNIAGAEMVDLLLSDATTFYQQASEQYAASNFEEALVLNNRALEIYQNEAVQAAFPEISRRQEANVLGNIGNAYDALEEYERAIAFQEQSIAIRREIGEHHNEAISLTNLGNTYNSAYDYENAVEVYRQALLIWREVDEREQEAATLEILANAQRAQYQYEQAIEYYEQLLSIRREANDSLGEAITLINLGISYKDLGQYQEAVDLYQQALSITREIDNRQQEANALGNLGNVYSALGNIQQAVEAYQANLEIAQEIGDASGEGNTLDSIGILYQRLGQYQRAIEFHQRAISIHLEARNRGGEATAINNLGFLYSRLGQNQQAIALYEQSLSISREINDLSGEALALRNLAQVLPNRVRASELLFESIDIVQNLNDRLATARAWSDLAGFYLERPIITGVGENGTLEADLRYQDAFDAFQQALLVVRELGLRQEEDTILKNLGYLYEQTGDYPQAIDYYLQGLEIARELGYPASEADALVRLGILYWNLSNRVSDPQSDIAVRLRVDAEDALLKALEILDTLREGNLSDADKIALFETQRNVYLRLQGIFVSQGRIEDALVASERARARVFVENLAARVSTLSEQEILDTVPSLEEIRRIARQQNTTLVSYSKSGTNLQVWVVQPSGEIAFESVEVAPDTPQSRAVETEDGQISFQSLPDEGVDLTELISDTRQSLGVQGSRAGAPPQLRPEILAQRQAETDQNLQDLHDLLITPIADLLPTDPEANVVFIPQGELFLVPFPALKDDNGKYLIEKHTILTAPSIQVLQLTHNIAAGANSPSFQQMGNSLIVGNPTMPTVTFLSEEGGFVDARLSPLHGAQREATAIADFLNTPALIGDQATETTVKQQLANADLIHLATHGLLEYGDPRETGSRDTPGAIALAPGNGDDGLLTSREILQMDLQADLVVLSACDTGRGRITGDGVIGLSRSFIAAGVPSVVVSLWAVPDAPTAELMTEFYNQLNQGQTKAQAMRQAMLITMQTHPDPKNWAAFTLIGNIE